MKNGYMGNHYGIVCDDGNIAICQYCGSPEVTNNCNYGNYWCACCHRHVQVINLFKFISEIKNLASKSKEE